MKPADLDVASKATARFHSALEREALTLVARLEAHSTALAAQRGEQRFCKTVVLTDADAVQVGEILNDAGALDCPEANVMRADFRRRAERLAASLSPIEP